MKEKVKHNEYQVINNLWSLVNLLNDDKVLFYIKVKSNNFIEYPISEIIKAEQPYIVKLIRQKKVYYYKKLKLKTIKQI